MFIYKKIVRNRTLFDKINNSEVLLNRKNVYILVLLHMFLEVFLLFEEENWLGSEWENNKQVEQKEWKKKKIKRHSF